MHVKKIVYSTQVYFLDTAIEFINMLTEQGFEVHVLIEISPNQLKANILNIETDLENYTALTPFEKVEKSWGLEYLSPYFRKCISVNFTVYSSKNLFKTWKVSKKMQNYISKINPDYIHLDDFSNRTLFNVLYLLFYRKKLIANIHDPVTHTGEFKRQRELNRKIWFSAIPSFVVFSEFSKSILKPQLSKRKKITVLKLMPYTVYRSFLPVSEKKCEKGYITFVGRISPYKGIELFIGAIDKITRQFPETNFFVGGKTIDGYTPKFLSASIKNLTIENKFLTNTEIVSIINRSMLVICPYIDATQSGVIMTAQALECPVLITNTGGLPEYVIENKTGIIVNEISTASISDAIVDFLSKQKLMEFQKNLKEDSFRNENKNFNQAKLPSLYS